MARWIEDTQSWEYEPGEVEAQVAAALASETGTGGAEGLHVRYLATKGSYQVTSTNGVTFGFPAKLVQGLEGRSAAELRSVHFLPDGDTLEWDRLDLHLSLAGLMAGSFGNAAWNEALAAETRKRAAAHAGKATSPRKAASSAANGKKGGRPRKNVTVVPGQPKESQGPRP